MMICLLHLFQGGVPLHPGLQVTRSLLAKILPDPGIFPLFLNQQTGYCSVRRRIAGGPYLEGRQS